MCNIGLVRRKSHKLSRIEIREGWRVHGLTLRNCSLTKTCLVTINQSLCSVCFTYLLVRLRRVSTIKQPWEWEYKKEGGKGLSDGSFLEKTETYMLMHFFVSVVKVFSDNLSHWIELSTLLITGSWSGRSMAHKGECQHWPNKFVMMSHLVKVTAFKNFLNRNIYSNLNFT